MELVHYLLYIAGGVGLTLQLLAGGLAIGCSLGVVMAAVRYATPLGWLVRGFVSILRGTPLMLQMGLVYFSLPGLLGITLSVTAAGILAFGINSSAYVAEILRSGIESLPVGQFEAARVLGIPTWHLWKDIILPQVVRNVLPSLVNEVIALLKETPLIAVLGGLDIMRRAQMVATEQFTYFWPLCVAGVYYYLLVMGIEIVGNRWAAAKDKQ